VIVCGALLLRLLRRRQRHWRWLEQPVDREIAVDDGPLLMRAAPPLTRRPCLGQSRTGDVNPGRIVVSVTPTRSDYRVRRRIAQAAVTANKIIPIISACGVSVGTTAGAFVSRGGPYRRLVVARGVRVSAEV
jgi:hypothetical protein